MKSGTPTIVAAACRVVGEHSDARALRFHAEGIGGTLTVVRIVAPSAPQEVRVGGKPLDSDQYDYSDGTLRIRFANSVDRVPAEVRFAPLAHGSGKLAHRAYSRKAVSPK